MSSNAVLLDGQNQQKSGQSFTSQQQPRTTQSTSTRYLPSLQQTKKACILTIEALLTIFVYFCGLVEQSITTIQTYELHFPAILDLIVAPISTFFLMATLMLNTFLCTEIIFDIERHTFEIGPTFAPLEPLMYATFALVAFVCFRNLGMMNTTAEKRKHMLDFNLRILVLMQTVLLCACLVRFVLVHDILNPWLDDMREAWKIVKEKRARQGMF